MVMGSGKKATMKLFAKSWAWTRDNSFLILLLVVYVLPILILFSYFLFRSDGTDLLQRIMEGYRAFDATNGLFLWSTGLTLSLLGYYTFIIERRRERKRLEEMRAKDREKFEIEKAENVKKHLDNARQYFINRLDQTSHIIQEKIVEIIIAKMNDAVDIKHCLELQHLYFKWVTDFDSLTEKYGSRIVDLGAISFAVGDLPDKIREEADDKSMKKIQNAKISDFEMRKNQLMELTVVLNLSLLDE